MRVLLALLAAVVAGAVAAAVVVSQRAAERSGRQLAQAQSRWETEKATLEAEIGRRLQATASDQTPPLANAAGPAAEPGRAPAALQRLLRLRPASAGADPADLRRMVHELENLRETGPAAVEPIRIFLAEGHDFSATTAAPPGEAPPSPEAMLRFPRPSMPPDPPLEFAIPPTLRLGLFGVLRSIGGDAAERVLAENLTRTSRGAEIAYLTRILDDAAPGKYRELAVTAARDLLTTPPDDLPPAQFLAVDAPCLYRILHRFEDRVFATAATNLLVTPDGRIDRWVVGYLDDALQERAVPVLVGAWDSPAVTRLVDRIPLAGAVLPYAGRHPAADALVRNLLLDGQFPSGVRSLALQLLADAAPPGDVPSRPRLTPAGASARLKLLQGLELDPLDPTVRRAHERALESLRRVAQGGTPLPATEFGP